MSTLKTKSTQKYFGFVLDRDIDLWSSQAKKKAKQYERNINSATQKKYKKTAKQYLLNRKNINNQQNLSVVLDSSLNTLRQKNKSQRSVSSTLSNRIKYLEVDLKRKRQMAQIAKNKYQKVMQTRTKSFQQKSMLNRQRQFFKKNHFQSVTLQASRIKYQRNNSTISTNNITSKNRSQAKKLKQKTIQNQKLIHQRQQMQRNKKRTMVEKSHYIQQIGKQKIKSINKAKELEAKQIHNKKILHEYAKVQMQKKKTSNLTNLFKSKVKEIQQSAKKYSDQLREYQQILGLRLNQKFKNFSSTVYITTS